MYDFQIEGLISTLKLLQRLNTSTYYQESRIIAKYKALTGKDFTPENVAASKFLLDHDYLEEGIGNKEFFNNTRFWFER